ncbi:MAG: lipase/acyltransferase domain-containing protein, partial [Nitrospirales bacterium]
YGSLLDTLKQSNNGSARIIPFTYDWRKDLMEAVHNLHTLILQLQKEGTHDISVVAHSLGGLIVSYYLRYGIQKINAAVETWEGANTVSAVVMAGVPFRGVMNSFRNMNFGVTAKFNTALLTSEAYSSFPSSYYTLPILDMDRLLTPKGTPLNNQIRNSNHWKQMGWGLLNKKTTLSDEIIDRRATYMSFWLHRSQRFLELLHSASTTPSRYHPSLLYLYATGRPTLATGIWRQQNTQGTDSLLFDNRERIKALTTIAPNLLYADGDETVTVDSASLPNAYIETFPTTLRDYEVGHTELVTDSTILQDINTFLQTH